MAAETTETATPQPICSDEVHYALLHAKAYQAFIEFLALHAHIHSTEKPVNELRVNSKADEQAIMAAARQLALKCCEVGMLKFKAMETPPLAGVPYHARIGPLRMVVQYHIQTDTMLAGLFVMNGESSNGPAAA